MSKVLDAISKSGFATVDMFILVFYLILLIGLGWFLSRNKNGKEKSANDYFLARQHAHLVGCGCLTDCGQHLGRAVHRYVWYGLPRWHRHSRL